jgi:MoaA/NifB/PqqE/SkfB family radical SAM enzyme
MRGATLLWALRSPCNLNCQYCYFGTVGSEQDRTKTAWRPGELSHIGRNDLSLPEIRNFIATLTPQLVHRVFVAGGEPLIWRGIVCVLSELKQAGCEVIVCTNGLPLAKEHLSTALLDLPVDAVSISLDSFDAAYHDHWRQDRSGQGWHGVMQGMQTLLRLRNQRRAQTRIGVYSVVTRQNLGHVVQTGKLVADLGADYFIVQPVSLAPDHCLHDELTLDARHREDFAGAVAALKASGLNLYLPHPGYIGRVLQTLTVGPLPAIKNCFGGRDLFFLEPDGSLWDCPSMYKIALTPPEQHLSILGHSAEELFSAERRRRNTDCGCFSQDCVNMWQLMSFDDILAQQGGILYDSLA